jgi:hypothetical protein
MMITDKPSFWHMLRSVLAAMLGVQKSDNAKKDFTSGNPWVYVSIGVAFILLFVITLLVVAMVVANP